MNLLIVRGIVMILGILGTAAALSGIFGVVSILPSSRRSVLADFRADAVEEERHWPLAARIAKSFSGLGKRGNDQDSTQSLELRLQKAGFPYYSAAHYYSRQLAYTFLFGSFGLFLGVVGAVIGINVNAWVILLLSLLFAYWGSMQPRAEVERGLKKRREGMLLDMAEHLTRFIVQVKSRGALQEALMGFAQNARVSGVEGQEGQMRMSISQEELDDNIRLYEAEKRTYANLIGTILAGFGGNLFADLINRLAAELQANRPIEEVVETVKCFYPYSLELDQFLNILVGGMRGTLPLVVRLQEYSVQIKGTRRQMRREAGAKTRQMVMLGSALMLLPIFIVFIAPMFQTFTMFFR